MVVLALNFKSINFNAPRPMISLRIFSSSSESSSPPRSLQAAERNDCSGLVEYLLDLCKAFNRFYRECPVLAAENEALAAARLALASAVHRVVADGLNTLTIGVPEAM